MLRSFDTKKYTIKISLTKTVFSFASSVDALDINAWDRGISAKKKCKKVTKNHILKPPTFTLIMLSSIQPVRIPKKITVFFNNSCQNFKIFCGTGKNGQKWGFKSIKHIFAHQYFSVLTVIINKYD